MVDRSVLVRLGLDPSGFNRGLAAASTGAKAFVRDLDSADSRMTNLVQSSLALGPALVPIGAAGVGAIAGLASSLTAAAAGAGIAIFAFQGVGDALKALNDFQLEPTDAHFQKLQETMAGLGPAGQNFVLFLQEARPELEKLQGMAQAGLLPGVEDGLSSLLDLMPDVTTVVSSLSDAVGDMARDGGAALQSPFWRDFLTFLAIDGRDALVTMGRIVGNLTKGAAGLVMAFDPLSDDIGTSLLSQAQAFSEWADNLEDTQGFQDFLSYVHDVGPDAWQALGAIASALLAIVQAAAPVGAVSLPILEALADVIGAVASSNVGPILIGTAAGLSAISRAVALYNATSGSALGGLLFGKDGKQGILGGKVSGQQVAIRGTAAAIGLLALSMTDLDDSLGLSNTANFAVIGAAFGPWGAAVGGLTGLVRDLASANDDLDASLKRVSQSGLDFMSRSKGLGQAQDELGGIEQKRSNLGKVAAWVPIAGPYLQQGINSKLNQDLDEGAEKARQARIETLALQQGVADLNNAVNGGQDLSLYGAGLDEIQDAADRMTPALLAAGYSMDDIENILLTRKGWDGAVDAIQNYTATQDSVAGRTGEVIDAVSGLDDQMLTAAESADAFANALDALLGPELGVAEATDNYTASLKSLVDDINKTNRSLRGNSAAALQNRAAVRGRVTDLTDQLKAEAAAGASADQLSRSFQRQRQRLLDAGEAAGLSRDQMKDYLVTLGLTPRLVKTLIQANTSQAEANLRRAKQILDSLRDKTITLTTVQSIVTQDSTQAARERARSRATNPWTGGYMTDLARAANLAGGGYALHPVGLVSGGGSPTSDSVPANLSRKEFVTNAWATDKAGVDAMYALNAGNFDRAALRAVLGFAAGGAASHGQRPNITVKAPAVAVSSGPMVMDGKMQITNWETGEVRFRGIARGEIDANEGFAGAVARQDG